MERRGFLGRLVATVAAAVTAPAAAIGAVPAEAPALPAVVPPHPKVVVVEVPEGCDFETMAQALIDADIDPLDWPWGFDVDGRPNPADMSRIDEARF